MNTPGGITLRYVRSTITRTVSPDPGLVRPQTWKAILVAKGLLIRTVVSDSVYVDCKAPGGQKWTRLAHVSLQGADAWAKELGRADVRTVGLRASDSAVTSTDRQPEAGPAGVRSTVQMQFFPTDGAPVSVTASHRKLSTFSIRVRGFISAIVTNAVMSC